MSTLDPHPISPLADPSRVQALLDEAHQLFRTDDGGEVSDLYPPLAAADPAIFGLGLCDINGRRYHSGDSAARFVLMSVAKPFTFALVCDTVGVEVARERLGANATGLPFNSLEAVERNAGRTNPMVNSGAIATVDLLGRDPWPPILANLSKFAARDLSVDEEVLTVVESSNKGNRALTHALDSFGMFDHDPPTVLDAYTRQCCVSVDSEDLAVMGATLANGGVNPVSGEAVVSPGAARAALAVMTTAGLYETSGDWLFRVQLPGKSGVSGGIVAVSPGKGAFATYSPRIDEAANSIRGQLAAEFLSGRLGLGILSG